MILEKKINCLIRNIKKLVRNIKKLIRNIKKLIRNLRECWEWRHRNASVSAWHINEWINVACWIWDWLFLKCLFLSLQYWQLYVQEYLAPGCRLSCSYDYICLWRLLYTYVYTHSTHNTIHSVHIQTKYNLSWTTHSTDMYMTHSTQNLHT